MLSIAGCGPTDFKVAAIISSPVSKAYPNLGHLEMLPDLRNHILMGLKESKSVLCFYFKAQAKNVIYCGVFLQLNEGNSSTFLVKC